MRLLPYAMPGFMLRMSLTPGYGDKAALTDALFTRYRDMMLAPGVRRAIIARMQQVRLVDPAPLLRRISQPVLLLWGTADAMIPFSNAADYQRALSQAKLATLQGVGHLPQEEAPAVSLAYVMAFLAGG
jgi:pimeloyl-ACP methyl ester carboxylesterase